MRTTIKTSLLTAGMAALMLIPLSSANAGNSRHGLNLIFGYSDHGHHGHHYSPLSYSYSYSTHRPSHHGHHYGNHHDSYNIHYRGKHNKHHRKHRRHHD